MWQASRFALMRPIRNVGEAERRIQQLWILCQRNKKKRSFSQSVSFQHEIQFSLERRTFPLRYCRRYYGVLEVGKGNKLLRQKLDSGPQYASIEHYKAPHRLDGGCRRMNHIALAFGSPQHYSSPSIGEATDAQYQLLKLPIVERRRETDQERAGRDQQIEVDLFEAVDRIPASLTLSVNSLPSRRPALINTNRLEYLIGNTCSVCNSNRRIIVDVTTRRRSRSVNEFVRLDNILVLGGRHSPVPIRKMSTTGSPPESGVKSMPTLNSGAPEDLLTSTTTKEPNNSSPQSTEPDFASYLTGEILDPILAATDPATNVTLGGSTTGTSRRKRRPTDRFIYDFDHDQELYRQVRRRQLIQKEKSRLKTATNVYRALAGNVVICAAKFGAWAASGSSAILAEFVHSVVDCGNQALLLIGLHDARLSADRKHPYGYGKSIYFWALVSALGTFFLGAGVSMTHAIGDLMQPSLQVITWHVWGVLGMSLAVDGYVFQKTIRDIMHDRPAGVTRWAHLNRVRDPATLAILLEDGAACLGVLFAVSGIAASHATGNPIYDGMAGVAISGLLGAMGITLVRVNHRFLLGQGVDREIIDHIETILLNRRSIDSIGSVQSQWTGPETFSYKAEVDFDGTYLAAKLMPVYQQEFKQIRDSMDEELQVLLALYAEDVIRTAEREVRHVEALIRQQYPGAEYIELEPMSRDSDRLAIDDNLEAGLMQFERDALNRYLRSLKSEEQKSRAAAEAKQQEVHEQPAEHPPPSTSEKVFEDKDPLRH